MFEFDAGKLIIIGIVALIVIGPKELPRVMRHVGEAMAKMRRMAADFRGQFLEAMREAEIDDIKAGVEKLANYTKPELGVDTLAQIKAELTQALEGAEKPPVRQPESATALAATQKSDFSLDATALPNSPEIVGSAGAGAVNAEMRALADALTAEIDGTKPVGAGSESAKAHAGE